MEPILELVARFAPVVYLDAREPFPPVCVGYSVITRAGESPSFQRTVEIEPPVARVIEYALWSDWDMGHLYELEHLWVYLDGQNNVVDCEGSWHGFYHSMKVEGALEGERPVVYSQPGKHAFAPLPEGFADSREECERECGPQAGKGGLLITHLYLGAWNKNPADDALIRAYLQRRAFAPAWDFSRRFVITPDMLVPWRELHAYIPPRVEWWLAQLRDGLQ